jgi:hypothetical protein
VHLARDGKTADRKVHQLVLEAFVGPRPDGCRDVRHINGDKADNRVENLVWATQSENMQDKWRHGTMYTGDRHHMCKYGADDVKLMRAWARSGVRTRLIATHYGIHPSTVRAIVRGVTWAWVE